MIGEHDFWIGDPAATRAARGGAAAHCCRWLPVPALPPAPLVPPVMSTLQATVKSAPSQSDTDRLNVIESSGYHVACVSR
jgi:hypothetical protein